jgi:hypothetical protein
LQVTSFFSAAIDWTRLRKKRLAGAVLADGEPDARAAVGDAVEVLRDGGDFAGAADLNVLETDGRDNACAQGRDDGVALTRSQAGRGAGLRHLSISSNA